MRTFRFFLVFLMAAVLLLMFGCDPETAILKVFTNQGLTLIKPARDYIAIGGIVVLPKGSKRLQYMDPNDVLPAESGTSTSFQAVIDAETDTTSTGAQAALALSQLLSLPIGFNFNQGQQVKLTQITSSGQHLTGP